jgi:hypothetical protein
MIPSRKLMLLTATTLAAAAITVNSLAQNAAASIPASAELRAPIDTGEDMLRSRQTPSTFGLKPQPGSANPGIALPFGMNYSRETKSLMMPLDPKSEWGVGLNLNVNSSPGLEQSPSSGLGLQPKRTPGVTLQKKF